MKEYEALERVFDEEPEVLDENDPEVKEEMFQTSRACGTTPEQITDPVYREEYREWLKTH